MRAANFVEETTTSIAGTGGNGAVTLTAIASTPRFSTVFGTQATTIRYVIEDTVSKSFEVGVGSVAGNVLTRTRPQITWNGTTYDDSTPSAIAFGSTPTSGNIKIRIAATAESQGAAFGSVQTVATGDNWRDYPFSDHFLQNTGIGNTTTLTAAREYYQPYKLDRAGLLTGFQSEVVTSPGASNYKLALYPCTHAGIPGSKILDFVTQSAAAGGFKSDTATGSWTPAGPVWLTPGWYYIGMIGDAAIGMRSTTGNIVMNQNPLGRKNGYGYGAHLFIAGNYTTGLPAVPDLTGASLADNAVGHFWFGLKVDA